VTAKNQFLMRTKVNVELRMEVNVERAQAVGSFRKFVFRRRQSIRTYIPSQKIIWRVPC